jgi:hypothetical protein
MARLPNLDHYIYVISESPAGPVKIGISSNPGARIVELQTGNHRPLSLVYVSPGLSRSDVLSLERSMHASFAEDRISGEWFDVIPRHAVYALMAELDV